mgnify:CR=1 FL=1
MFQYAAKYTFTLKVTVPSISKKSASTKVGLATKSALKLKLNMSGAGEDDRPEWGVRFFKEYDENEEITEAERLGYSAESVIAFESYEGEEDTGKGSDDAQSIRIIGLRPGTVYVTASMGGMEQGICKVTVSAPKLAKSKTVKRGKTVKLSVTNIGDHASISWESGTGESDTASVEIGFSEKAEENEDYRVATITGGSEAGKCTVTVDINGYMLHSMVTVK